MGKRVAVGHHHGHHASVDHAQHDPMSPPPTRSIRKRKRNSTAGSLAKALRLSGGTAANHYWHENDDEDSSSNDAPQRTPPARPSTKHANNSSILLNASFNACDTSVNESPKPVYTLRPSVVNGTILYDLMRKPWRLGRPIGKGNFGEIFLASDSIAVPVTNENAKFVVKIEPHSNGPLFVEIHCLMNTGKKNSDDGDGGNEREQKSLSSTAKLPQNPPSGIPDYIASGSHYFGDARYRFLVLQRFDRDLHSLIKNCRVHQKSVLTLAVQIVDVLENMHDQGYCHNDVKAQNLMISKCKYLKQQKATAPASAVFTNGKSDIKKKYDDHYEEKQQTTDSGNSSEQEANDDEDDEDFVVKRKTYDRGEEDDDEDFDDGATSNSNNSNSMDLYQTPVNRSRKRNGRTNAVEYSGSNPVRSCRRQKRNSIYEEMVKSHYLRPAKRISYSEFYNEDGMPLKSDTSMVVISSDDESEEFLPKSARRMVSCKKSATASATAGVIRRLTRRQEKLLAVTTGGSQQQQHNRATAATAVTTPELVAVDEERIFLIDFGLASKFIDNGVHRPFVMDQRRAHDGTLEFTSRDAHMGAHSRRSDLECLGYNLIFWSQGYLPWKEAATQHQQEKVHRAKEYLMTDVREMLKQIYGKLVPKYLGEFLHQVGQLAYHERPDYARYRRIFEREFQQLGYLTHAGMRLDSHEIVRTCVRVKEEIENKNDIFEMNKHSNNNVLSIMKNISVGTPFHERTLSNRVSPKNLRSKSDKKSLKKKKFSWAEILSQDPDQIARERAEKEFDREEDSSEVQQPPLRRYQGKPTYAILEIQQRLKCSGRLVDEAENGAEEPDDDEDEENEEEEDDDEEATSEPEVGDDETEECEEEQLEEDDEEADEDDLDETNEGHDEEDVEEEIESDASEASEQQFHGNGRNRRTRNKKSDKVRTNRKSASKVSNTATRLARTRGGGGGGCKRNSVTKSTAKTRSSATTATRNTSKRRRNIKVTTVADEFEHGAPARYFDNGNGHGPGGCGGDGGGGGKPPERRTRRCLIKTDAEVEEEESNSNFSPDVRSLFNVWKKINTESMYYRGSGTAAARHCKK